MLIILPSFLPSSSNISTQQTNKKMEERKIVVVVEEAEASKTALKWALHNILRFGDILTLVHVFPPSKNIKLSRLLRLKAYDLALAFKDICISSSFNTKIEIVVTEDDAQQGERVVELVREIDAFALVLGLHRHSFLYKLAIRHTDIRSIFKCKVHAVKQPTPSPRTSSPNTPSSSVAPLDGLPDLEFSLIDVSPLQFPDMSPRKIRYQICPSTSAIIWRSKKTRRRQRMTALD